MNIKKFMQAHESAVREKLPLAQNKEDWDTLKSSHARMIRWMQHERLVHLLVTLAFGIGLLVAAAMTLVLPGIWIYLLAGLLLLLFIPYVSHYFYLENTVQRWYRLANEIDDKMRVGS